MHVNALSILAASILGSCLALAAAMQVPPSKSLPAVQPGAQRLGDGFDWIKSPPEGSFAAESSREIPASDFYEVVASKDYVAIQRDLVTQTSVKITPDTARYFTGPYFRCPEGKTPYLVRAVYGHGGTGRYELKRNGRKLLVEHGSLGHSDAANKSALVVNLDFEPEAAYAVVHIAE
jgi:hypothetical protein